MSQQVITTTPVRFRYRTAVIVLGVVAALAIGVGVAVNSIDSGGSETSVQQAAPAAVGAPRTAAVRERRHEPRGRDRRRCRGASRPRWWPRSRRVCPTFSVTWY